MTKLGRPYYSVADIARIERRAGKLAYAMVMTRRALEAGKTVYRTTRNGMTRLTLDNYEEVLRGKDR